MKKVDPIKYVVLGIICLFGITALIAFMPPKENPVKITLTTQEWEKVINHLEAANKAVLRSQMPSDKAQDISLDLQQAVQLLGSKIEKQQKENKPYIVPTKQ